MQKLIEKLKNLKNFQSGTFFIHFERNKANEYDFIFSLDDMFQIHINDCLTLRKISNFGTRTNNEILITLKDLTHKNGNVILTDKDRIDILKKLKE